MTYCCSDLHGCFDIFIKLLKRIIFSSNDTMYVLGDNVDRGSQPVELLKYIYEHDNIISLIGNHEEFLLKYTDGNFNNRDRLLWDKNDGEITRLAFDKLKKDDPVLCKNIIDDIKTWDTCITIDQFILSHAGYNAKKLKRIPPVIESLKEMTYDEFLWSREDFYKYKGIEDYITIFGHTPTRFIREDFNQKYSDDIWVCNKYHDKIGIDGAVSCGGQLNCINLDSMEIIVV